MRILEPFIFSLFFFFFFSVTNSQRCFNPMCGVNEPAIRFPFRLHSLQPERCGYPGFDLSCNTRGETVLKLPYSGEFVVRFIDYAKQQIWLDDPKNCLLGRLLTLNLSNSPFGGVYYQNFMFLNCPSEFTRYQFSPITCLSNSSYSVLATSSVYFARLLSGASCTLISTVLVPVQEPAAVFDPEVSPEFDGNLILTWVEPNCGSCEERGGRCEFMAKANATLATGCSNLSRRGLPRSARYAVSIGVGIPSLLCLMGLICYVCGRVKACSRRRDRQATESSFSAVSPQSVVIMGLDGPTIESYPKLVLGESRRIPKPNDNVCPICLSEYRPKETLRSIPECQHCFHADCIDEWLQMNATCPVCRTLPEKTKPTHAT